MPSLYPIKLYARHPATILLVSASVLANIAVWLWIGLQIPPTDELVFLHYTILFGVDTTGQWADLFAVPFGGFAAILINAAIGWIFFQRDKYIAHVLNAIALAVQLFLFAAAVLLVTLNG
jgi:hypothetical protein